MPLLPTAEYRDELIRIISVTETDLDIVPAFITRDGIVAAIQAIPPSVRVRVLTRWRLADLISGASSLEVFPLLKERKIRLFINQNVHAKLAMSDKKVILVGSANLTRRGLSLGFDRMNYEIGVVVNADSKDHEVIERLFEDSVVITEPLFREISACVEAAEPSTDLSEDEYPANLLARLSPAVSGLWVRDLFWSTSRDNLWLDNPDSIHDRALLGLESQSVEAPVSPRVFRELKCVRWLTQQLAENGGELYFGSVSNLLHDALLEDPKPYRKDVKMLAANLSEWCTRILWQTFVTDTPNYSQRVRFSDVPSLRERRQI